MSTAIAVYHGVFGRACLYSMNRAMTKHAHREGHLCFHVDGGHAVKTIGSGARLVTPETAVGVNPWELHSFDPCEEGGVYLVLYIRPDWFRGMRRTNAVDAFGRPEIEVNAYLSRRVRRIADAMLSGAATDRFDGLLYELTEESFAQTQVGRNAARQTPGTAFSDFRVRKSMQLITDRLEEGVSLEKVARESGLSRPHFFKLFRMQTGLTPNLFLNTLRMERAVHYLVSTTRPVTDIGFDLGFSSQSSFTRFFATNVGMAPSDYRRVACTV